MLVPQRQALAQLRGPVGGRLLQQLVELLGGAGGRLGAAFAGGWFAAEQDVELAGDQFAVRVQVVQKGAAVAVAQRAGNPGQVVVAGRQDVGLLVVKVLDAVLDAAQKVVSPRHRISRFLRHQARLGDARQRLHRGPGAQLGKLPAAHHLQHLHGKFNLADAAA